MYRKVTLPFSDDELFYFFTFLLLTVLFFTEFQLTVFIVIYRTVIGSTVLISVFYILLCTFPNRKL